MPIYGGALSSLVTPFSQPFRKTSTANFTVSSRAQRVEYDCDRGPYGIGGYGAESRPNGHLAVLCLTVRLVRE